MRTLKLSLLVLLVVGCDPSSPEPNSNTDQASDLTTSGSADMPESTRSSTEHATAEHLHTDEFIESLAGGKITALDGGIDPDNPILDVVPSGESHPRGEVFRKLNLDESKLGNFRTAGMNMVDLITWQVSPAYDITCMSANNDPDNKGLEMTDPNRKVYGIRLSRTAK